MCAYNFNQFQSLKASIDILMQGPIEVLIDALLMYLPLILSGRLFLIASKKASKFCSSFSWVKLLFPNLPIINELSLTRYSIIPILLCLTVSIKSSGLTKLPDFTFGIMPLGPNILACCLKSFICSGVATILSKSISPSPIFFKVSASPTMSAPASVSYS